MTQTQSDTVQKVLTFFTLQGKTVSSMNSNLFENGDLDSIGVLDLVDFIEDELGVQLQQDDLIMENFQSVLRIAETVNARR